MPAIEPAIRKYVHSGEGLREVIQETFIRVWMSRDKLPGLEKPLHWLYRVASNECFTWLRKEAIWDKHVAQLARTMAFQEEGQAVENMAAAETRELIHKAINKLSPQRRLIFNLNRNEGLPTAEIAEKLNLSHSHVKNSLSESLRFIREYLAASGKIMTLLYLFLK